MSATPLDQAVSEKLEPAVAKAMKLWLQWVHAAGLSEKVQAATFNDLAENDATFKAIIDHAVRVWGEAAVVERAAPLMASAIIIATCASIGVDQTGKPLLVLQVV
jgi:hypothetical protein